MSTFNKAEAVIGHGKSLAWSDTVNGTYVPFGGTVEVGLPESELGAVEVTNDDTPDYYKDFIPGLYDPGTIDFTYKFGKTVFAQVDTLYALATVAATRPNATKYWQLTYPDGSKVKWPGFLTKNHVGGTGQEDNVEVEASIQVTGKITFIPYVAP